MTDKKKKWSPMRIYWVYYFIIVAPVMIANLFISDDSDFGKALSAFQLLSLLPMIGFLVWQMLDMHKTNKKWNARWKEEMEEMKHFNEDSPKKLAAIRKKYES